MNICKKSVAFLLAVLLIMAVFPVAFAAEETVDTHQLEELLYVASKAKPTNYTAESWAAVEAAVAQGNAALNGGTQEEVDAAKTALARALAQVTSMDYSAMEEALAKAEQFMQKEEMAAYWKDLQDAIDAALALYGAGNQESVDRAANKINLRLEELQEYMENYGKAPTVWIVLFCVSLAGNVALAALFVRGKKRVDRNQIDDVPLVDYDIDDDIV